MAFPFTHLCVAYRILETRPLPEADAAQFLLGSIAPDAIHYRPAFQGAEMTNIGAVKKITHLCPVSNERWGAVTDNKGWVNCVKTFLSNNPKDPLAAGYAVHILTDIQNNRTLWQNFRESYPEEAAKGYASGYYDDLKNIDARLYKQLPEASNIMKLLTKAAPINLPGLVTAEEIQAIQNNILHEHFQNLTFDPTYQYTYVTYDNMLTFIQDAADFARKKASI